MRTAIPGERPFSEIPYCYFIFFMYNIVLQADVAQLVEQRIRNA
jgi:hypothetical protein